MSQYKKCRSLELEYRKFDDEARTLKSRLFRERRVSKEKDDAVRDLERELRIDRSAVADICRCRQGIRGARRGDCSRTVQADADDEDWQDKGGTPASPNGQEQVAKPYPGDGNRPKKCCRSCQAPAFRYGRSRLPTSVNRLLVAAMAHFTESGFAANMSDLMESEAWQGRVS